MGQMDTPNKGVWDPIPRRLGFISWWVLPLSLVACFWSALGVSGACAGASPSWCLQTWFFFFLSLYTEKGTSAVFKEQRWEENPTDGIRLMTALAYSLWKWWAANNVSAGKIPDLVLCEWVCVCLWKALRRGCWNSLGSIHMYIFNKKLRWGERKKIDWRQLEVNSIWHFKITQIFLSHSFDLSHNISATATSSLRVSTLERKPQQRPNCCSASPRRGC